VRKWLYKREKIKGKEVFLFSFFSVWINKKVSNYTFLFLYFRPLPYNQTVPSWNSTATQLKRLLTLNFYFCPVLTATGLFLGNDQIPFQNQSLKRTKIRKYWLWQDSLFRTVYTHIVIVWWCRFHISVNEEIVFVGIIKIKAPFLFSIIECNARLLLFGCDLRGKETLLAIVTCEGRNPSCNRELARARGLSQEIFLTFLCSEYFEHFKRRRDSREIHK